ncbi:MAG: formylglycine-generating enzyme family protein, partial [Cytophagaceae bacterium]
MRSLVLSILCFTLLLPDQPGRAQSTTGFVSYTQTIPGSDQSYALVAIPSGKGQMGSSSDQKGHQADESPVHTVTIEPFWMGKYEVTWDFYDLFAFTN